MSHSLRVMVSLAAVATATAVTALPALAAPTPTPAPSPSSPVATTTAPSTSAAPTTAPSTTAPTTPSTTASATPTPAPTSPTRTTFPLPTWVAGAITDANHDGILGNAGDTYPVTFTVTNPNAEWAQFWLRTGSGFDQCPGTALTGRSSIDCQATYTITAADVAAKSSERDQTVDWLDHAYQPVTQSLHTSVALPATPTAPTTPPAGLQAPTVSVGWSNDPAHEVEERFGYPADFVYFVKNPNSVPVTITSATADTSAISCVATTIQPGESVTCSGSMMMETPEAVYTQHATFVTTAGTVTATGVLRSSPADSLVIDTCSKQLIWNVFAKAPGTYRYTVSVTAGGEQLSASGTIGFDGGTATGDDHTTVSRTSFSMVQAFTSLDSLPADFVQALLADGASATYTTSMGGGTYTLPFVNVSATGGCAGAQPAAGTVPAQPAVAIPAEQGAGSIPATAAEPAGPQLATTGNEVSAPLAAGALGIALLGAALIGTSSLRRR